MKPDQVRSLDAIGLRKVFGPREVVAGVDLSVRAGEVVGLLGASGSGKSTIFNMVAGLVRPSGGRVVHCGRDISLASVDARARLGIGYVPQSPELFRKMTAEENLRLAIEARGIEHDKVEPLLSAVCRAFDIDRFRDTRLDRLSGGQRRWVEVAFAICGKPHFLLLDEPFAGLDPVVTDRLATLIRRLADMGMGILLTDHNVRKTLQTVERAYVLDNGVVIAEGPSGGLVDDMGVRSLFLGEDFRL